MEDSHRGRTSWPALPKESFLFLHVISKDDTLILEAKTLDLGSVSCNALMLKQWLGCLDETQYRNVKQYSLEFHIFIFYFLLHYVYWSSPAGTIRVKVVLFPF